MGSDLCASNRRRAADPLLCSEGPWDLLVRNLSVHVRNLVGTDLSVRDLVVLDLSVRDLVVMDLSVRDLVTDLLVEELVVTDLSVRDRPDAHHREAFFAPGTGVSPGGALAHVLA